MNNQLFKIIPKINVLLDIIKCFGLNNLDEKKYFSKDDLSKINSVDKIKHLNLEKYYLPCKSKIYINNLNNKKIITILRQFLKLYKYKLLSREKYINKKKIIIYYIIKLSEINYKPIILQDNKTIYF